MPGAQIVNALTLDVSPMTVGDQRAADHLIDYLVTRERVDVFFGLPGGAVSPLDDALFGRDDVRVIGVRHESDAVFAAAGYARATGKLGVALVTSGPGVLNALNALASAHLEGLPVLLLAGEASTDQQGRGALQDGSAHGLDIVHMARSITKATAQLTTPNAALLQLVSVIHAMRHGRQGAGLVTCPVDVTRARVVSRKVVLPTERPPVLDEDTLDRAAELLNGVVRPLILAGNGTRGGDSPAALRALAERLQAPVMTTPHGKGVFPESHPLALGVFGLAQHPSTLEYLKGGFDCLLAVGTSLSELATNGFSPLLRPSKTGTMIQIDVDASRMGRVYPVDVAILGEAAPALRSIANRIEAQPTRTYGIQHRCDPATAALGPEGRITPQRAIWELQRALPADTSFTSDSGEHTLQVLHHLRVDDSRAFMAALGLGSMGSGIGAALGIASASHGAPVVAIAGDGGFAMSLSAIATAAHARLPVVFAIFNDGRYGMCELGYRTDFGRTSGFDLGSLDIVRIAEGLGAQAIRIDGADQIGALCLDERVHKGPVVLDILIDREARVSSTARFAAIHDARVARPQN